MATELIFGHSWEDIQAMQQGKYKADTVSGPPSKPQATEADKKLLQCKGLAELKKQGLFGVIDRLQNSGIVPRTTN